NSGGSDHHSSAGFASGLRLEDTPFPDMPVGSLLVVLTDPGTDTIRDVRVVRSAGTSILIKTAADAHFVVNDKHCTDGNGNGPPLSLSVRSMTSELDAAKAAIGAMIDVLDDMAAQ